MTEAQAVVFGLTFISGVLAYYAFELRETPEVLHQNMAVFFFFMSIVFLDLVMFSVFRIAQESSLSYLASGILLTGLRVVIAMTSILALILLLSLLWLAWKGIMDWFKSIGRRTMEP